MLIMQINLPADKAKVSNKLFLKIKGNITNVDMTSTHNNAHIKSSLSLPPYTEKNNTKNWVLEEVFTRVDNSCHTFAMEPLDLEQICTKQGRIIMKYCPLACPGFSQNINNTSSQDTFLAYICTC